MEQRVLTTAEYHRGLPGPIIMLWIRSKSYECSLLRRDEEANKDSEREMPRTGVSARIPQMPSERKITPSLNSASIWPFKNSNSCS